MDSRHTPGQPRTYGNGLKFYSRTLGKQVTPADCYEMDDKELGIFWAECKTEAKREDDKIKRARVYSAKTFDSLCQLIFEGKVEA